MGTSLDVSIGHMEGTGFGRSGALRSKAELATAPLSSAISMGTSLDVSIGHMEGTGFGRSGALRSKAELATAPLSSAISMGTSGICSG